MLPAETPKVQEIDYNLLRAEAIDRKTRRFSVKLHGKIPLQPFQITLMRLQSVRLRWPVDVQNLVAIATTAVLWCRQTTHKFSAGEISLPTGL